MENRQRQIRRDVTEAYTDRHIRDDGIRLTSLQVGDHPDPLGKLHDRDDIGHIGRIHLLGNGMAHHDPTEHRAAPARSDPIRI